LTRTRCGQTLLHIFETLHLTERHAFFAGIGDQRPDEGFRWITEIFHLD